MGIQTGRGGRVDVQPDFSVKGFEGVYAVGDLANIGGVDGESLPQLASVAQQAGTYCAGHCGGNLGEICQALPVL